MWHSSRAIFTDGPSNTFRRSPVGHAVGVSAFQSNTIEVSIGVWGLAAGDVWARLTKGRTDAASRLPRRSWEKATLRGGVGIQRLFRFQALTQGGGAQWPPAVFAA